MKDKQAYYFYFSGELPSWGIPSHEVIAILNSLNENYEIIENLDQIMIINISHNICDIIAERAAYLHKCGRVLLNIFGATPRKIKSSLKEIDLLELVRPNSSFAVRIKKIKHYFFDIDEEKMEKFIGAEIKGALSPKKGKVNLQNPDILFLGFFTGDNFIFGVNYKNARRQNFRFRTPHAKPFFHPCGLDPFLARAMVNLSQVNDSIQLYDPFCGTGSILIEAAVIGSKIIGSDINDKMIQGSYLNLKAFRLQDINLFRADAKKICLRKKFCVVTDPPYGRASSLYGKDIVEILSLFFENNHIMIDKNGLNVIALPSELNINMLLSIYNLKIQHRFEFYVHRSLTRVIYVIQKM